MSAKYIMKCDDDTFVRVDAVIDEAKKVPEGRSLYVGNINYYHKPLRYGKWAVTYEVCVSLMMHPLIVIALFICLFYLAPTIFWLIHSIIFFLVLVDIVNFDQILVNSLYVTHASAPPHTHTHMNSGPSTSRLSYTCFIICFGPEVW